MIAYTDIEAKIKKRLGTTYVNDTHNPAAIKEYINDAIEKISETIIRNNFIYEYELVTTGDRNEYSIPLQHSTKQIFAGDKELIQWTDWVIGSESMNYPLLIAVYPDTFYVPESSDTTVYTILYRGVPQLVDLDVPATLNINLPRPYARAIIPLACYFAFLDVKQSEMAAEQLNFYREEISSIAGAMLDPDENNPKRMSGKHYF